MRLDTLNIWLLCIVGILICTWGASPDYVEGIDTTDINGTGLHSAINIINNGSTNGNTFIYYGLTYEFGYYKYSFDDIKMAPDSIYYTYNYFGNYCFVIKNNKDSTYSKIQILTRLADNRYIFKYGKNTTPNNRMLENANYDRSVRYKPNNFNFNNGKNISTWDPPLPNNNHLKGYIFYMVKEGISIDTTEPINLSQWDSIAFTSSTTDTMFRNAYYEHFNPESGYFNFVSTYTEGKSEFLNGWTMPFGDGVKQIPLAKTSFKNTLVVKKTSNGYFISLPLISSTNLIKSLSIYNAMGIKISRISSINKNQVFWKTSNRNFPHGLYIARLEFSDKTSCSRTLILTSQ
jgi:hypothetical protein